MADWQAALRESIAGWRDRAPMWAESDCVRFCEDYLWRLGVEVPVPEYTSKTAALRLLSERSMAEWCRTVLGEPLEPFDSPQPGGIVVACGEADGAVWEFPGVYNGVYVVCFTQEGLSRVMIENDAASIIEAWPCPQ